MSGGSVRRLRLRPRHSPVDRGTDGHAETGGELRSGAALLVYEVWCRGVGRSAAEKTAEIGVQRDVPAEAGVVSRGQRRPRGAARRSCRSARRRGSGTVRTTEGRSAPARRSRVDLRPGAARLVRGVLPNQRRVPRRAQGVALRTSRRPLRTHGELRGETPASSTTAQNARDLDADVLHRHGLDLTALDGLESSHGLLDPRSACVVTRLDASRELHGDKRAIGFAQGVGVFQDLARS